MLHTRSKGKWSGNEIKTFYCLNFISSYFAEDNTYLQAITKRGLSGKELIHQDLTCGPYIFHR